jgi:tRNA pseudouridine38-40 synthase
VSVPNAPDDVDCAWLVGSLNGMLGPHIATSACAPVDDSFDARHSARSRLYVYAVLQRPVPDPFLAPTTLWHRNPLDVDAMNEAAGHLVGARDFSSFGRVEEGASAHRSLFELRCRRRGDVIRIRARANSFIQQMVRSLAGTLVQVGEGRRSPDEIVAVLEAKDRATAGPVAPAHALCLVSVEYDEGWSRPPSGG